MTKKIEWVHVTNFRGISETLLKDIGQVNIFIGKNNVGKSTLLEAIYLNSAWIGRDVFVRNPFKVILYRRGLNPYIRKQHAEDDPLVYLSYFFRSWNKPIRIESNLGKCEFSISSEIGIGRFPDKIEGDNKRIYIVTEFGEPVFYIEPVESREYLEYIRYSIKWERWYTSFKDMLKVVLLDEHTFRTPHFGTSAIFDKIKKLEKISNVTLTGLQNFLTEITGEKIKDIEEKITDIMVIYKDGFSVPMSLMGDGIKAAVAYYYALNTKRGLLVLAEEPENHLHPSLMEVVAKEIAKTRSQVFITTHSIEFLRYVLSASLREGTDVKVFRFKSIKDGIPEIEVYNGPEANIAINSIGVDLR